MYDESDYMDRPERENAMILKFAPVEIEDIDDRQRYVLIFSKDGIDMVGYVNEYGLPVASPIVDTPIEKMKFWNGLMLKDAMHNQAELGGELRNIS